MFTTHAVTFPSRIYVRCLPISCRGTSQLSAAIKSKTLTLEGTIIRERKKAPALGTLKTWSQEDRAEREKNTTEELVLRSPHQVHALSLSQLGFCLAPVCLSSKASNLSPRKSRIAVLKVRDHFSSKCYSSSIQYTTCVLNETLRRKIDKSCHIKDWYSKLEMLYWSNRSRLSNKTCSSQVSWKDLLGQ